MTASLPHARLTASLVALAIALGLMATGVASVRPVHAAAGGPVILGGDDLTDHGFRDTSTNTNQDGWLYLEKAIENVLPAVTRAGNDGSIAALGSSDSTDTFGFNAGAAMHWAALDAGTGVSVTYYDGATAINGFFTALAAGTVDPAIIWISGDGAMNDLSDSGGAEAAALTANATSIGDFVNSGGGLISHGSEYGWLSALLPGATVVFGGNFGDLYLTTTGQTAFPGLTNDDINAGPWHNHFEGNLGGLGVLAASNVVDDNLGADAPVIIGGAAVTLPGSITLDPATATNPTGTDHTVTATVRDSAGVLLPGATVTFEVISGPNTGDTDTDVTDAAGEATFTWTGDGGTGTDVVEASFVDGGGTTRSTTASKTWETPAVVAECVDLIAAQDMDVGEVCVSNDATNLTVTYTTVDGWTLTETHLAISTDEPGSGEWIARANGWQSRSGNPAPGRFPYQADHDPAVTTYTYTIPLADISGGVAPGDELFIGAHAVVERETVVLLAAAPYHADMVDASAQGQRKDGTDVRAERSDSTQALTPGTGFEPTFYSLGFGGSIEVSFDCPITNGVGDDLRIGEVTHGTYPLETADVYAWDDTTSMWVLLGEATNTNTVSAQRSESDFDLGGLGSTKRIRIVDTSDPAAFEATADGFDLDGITALHDCTETVIERETAWGDGDRFVSQGDWAMYFTYEVQ